MAATLSFFILAMVLYPTVQDKLRKELQKIVGNGRLPKFAEVKDLPYLSAVIKETLRYKFRYHLLMLKAHGVADGDLWDL